MWTGRECVFRSRCSRYSEICPFCLCFCSFPLSRLKSHEPKTSASASASSQISADRDVVYRRHQERWCRKWAVWLLFVLLLYYFIKNSAEQCEHVSNWWTLPFLLVLYTITHTHTRKCPSTNNKCLSFVLNTRARLSERIHGCREDVRDQTSCLLLLLLRFRIMVDNLERHLTTLFC